MTACDCVCLYRSAPIPLYFVDDNYLKCYPIALKFSGKFQVLEAWCTPIFVLTRTSLPSMSNAISFWRCAKSHVPRLRFGLSQVVVNFFPCGRNYEGQQLNLFKSYRYLKRFSSYTERKQTNGFASRKSCIFFTAHQALHQNKKKYLTV